MKTIGYFVITALLIYASACSDQNASLVAPYESQNAQPGGKVVERAALTKDTPLPFFTKYDLARHNVTSISNPAARRAAGPFTVAGNLRRIFQNRKVILGNNQTLYPAAAYLCDVYICDYTITLPNGQFAGLQGASKTGYANFEFQTGTLNAIQTVNSNGTNTYTFSTYSIVPIYNMNGQYIYMGTIPQDLTGLTFTYSTFP